MELSKKTTILLSPDMHERLSRLAARRKTSLGSLVREAVTTTYGLRGVEERLDALHEAFELGLPVGEPAEMAAESVPAAEDPLP